MWTKLYRVLKNRTGYMAHFLARAKKPPPRLSEVKKNPPGLGLRCISSIQMPEKLTISYVLASRMCESLEYILFPS